HLAITLDFALLSRPCRVGDAPNLHGFGMFLLQRFLALAERPERLIVGTTFSIAGIRRRETEQRQRPGLPIWEHNVGIGACGERCSGKNRLRGHRDRHLHLARYPLRGMREPRPKRLNWIWRGFCERREKRQWFGARSTIRTSTVPVRLLAKASRFVSDI